MLHELPWLAPAVAKNLADLGKLARLTELAKLAELAKSESNPCEIRAKSVRNPSEISEIRAKSAELTELAKN